MVGPQYVCIRLYMSHVGDTVREGMGGRIEHGDVDVSSHSRPNRGQSI